jgi:hypothetical protein
VEVLAMKMRDVGLSLVGGGVIYLAMAACSTPSTGRIGPPTSLGGGGRSPAGQGGAGGGGGDGAGGSADSGIGDALLDPVATVMADPISGSRLRANYRLGSDGSKEYLPGSWFDSMLGQDCSFTTGADGLQRCLPDGASAQVFSDAACTTPILMMSAGCAMPTYAITVDSVSCSQPDGVTHVLALGAPVTPSTLYVQAGGNSCIAAGSPPAGYTYTGVGAEIPASTFVSATTGHD